MFLSLVLMTILEDHYIASDVLFRFCLDKFLHGNYSHSLSNS